MAKRTNRVLWGLIWRLALVLLIGGGLLLDRVWRALN
jgi:hypothetical protein